MTAAQMQPSGSWESIRARTLPEVLAQPQMIVRPPHPGSRTRT
jgi:hypothetical protein